MQKVLLVDDDKEIFEQVKVSLYEIAEVIWASRISEVRPLLGSHQIALILLDIGLPDGTGLELCSEIHSQHPELPIFFLTARNEIPQMVTGFSAGADDYVTKPFKNMELGARVGAKLRKIRNINQQKNRLDFEELEIHRSRQEVWVGKPGERQKVELTSLEFKLLNLFCDYVSNVIPRDRILNEVWGKDIYVYPRSVDTHISKLRKKLGPASSVIKSIHGVGYKFEPTLSN